MKGEGYDQEHFDSLKPKQKTAYGELGGHSAEDYINNGAQPPWKE